MTRRSLEFSSTVSREGKWYVAHCLELEIASQGKSVESALENLREAIELYLEDENVKAPEVNYQPMVTVVKGVQPLDSLSSLAAVEPRSRVPTGVPTAPHPAMAVSNHRRIQIVPETKASSTGTRAARVAVVEALSPIASLSVLEKSIA